MDRKFFSRVYVRAAIIGVVATLVSLGLEQRAISWGILSGVLVGLFSLWTVEVTVRLLFTGGRNAWLRLGFGALVKFPFLGVGVYAIGSAAYSGFLNIFAMVCGTLIVQGTMVVMVIASAMAHKDRLTERYQ